MAINVPLNAQFQNADQAATYLQGVCQSAVNKVKFNLGGASGAKAFSSLSQPLGRLTGQADEFTKSLDAANARVLAFGASVGVVNAVTNAFKSLVSSTIEVEKAITAISVVGDQFTGKTKELSQGLFNIAKETGQSFSEVSKAALEFSRQGLKLEDTLSRTKDALILTRTTGLETTKSVEGLSAAVSAFAREGLSASRILNKLAAVDQAFKVSSADLIQAFERTGAAAQQAGVTFDELAGIVTALQADTSRGGAVIGNSLKTIFTRLGEVDKLEKLKGVGIIVQDLSGEILPASKILQNLANDVQGFSKLTQSGIFKDIAGTFQINQLIALVGDLTKKNSIAAEATKKSAGATNEAYVANEKLNQSLDAILNKVANTGKQLGSILGELGLTDNLNGLLDGINSFLEGANSLLQGDDLGSNFAKGFVKGIGGVLSGPGLGIFLAIIGKLSLDLAKFGLQSLKAFFGIGKAAADQKLVQESIVQTLIRNQGIANAILSTQGGQNAQALKFLGLLNQQAAAMQTIQGVAGGIASPVYAQGYRATSEGLQRKSKAAGGYLPAQEASDVRRGVGGASPSSKVVSIPNFAFGGGKRGTMIANTSEYIVPNYAGGGSAIFNQDMVKSIGLPAGAKKISAAGGFVPNFAGNYIYDSDRFLGENKKLILENVLASTKKKDVLVAPSGAGKSTYAKSLGTFISSLEDVRRASSFTILSAAGLSKTETGLSKKFESILNASLRSGGKISYLGVSNEEIENRRKVRQIQGLTGGDVRSAAQLSGSLKIEKNNFKFIRALQKSVQLADPATSKKRFEILRSKEKVLASEDLGVEKTGDKYAMLVNDLGGARKKQLISYKPRDGERVSYLADIYGIQDIESLKNTSKLQKFNQKYSSQSLEKKYTDLALQDASDYSNDLIGKPLSPIAATQLSNKGSVPSLVGSIFESAISSALQDEELLKAQSERNSNALFDFKGVANSKFNKFFGIPNTVDFVEAKYADNDSTRESFASKIYKEQSQKNVEKLIKPTKAPGPTSQIRSEKDVLRTLQSTSASKGLFNFAIARNFEGKVSLESIEKLKKAGGIQKFNASAGYVPNFAAAALQQAIAREKSAGLSDSQIYVDQSAALKSSMNPMGLMVANRRDEPAGGFQGIARARKEGVNPKLYGAANGFVPNFAPAPIDRKAFGASLPKSVNQQLTGFANLIDEINKKLAKNKITQEDAIKELEKFVTGIQVNKNKLNTQTGAGLKAFQAAQNQLVQAPKEAKEGFADLAGKLIIAQSAMTFLTTGLEEAGGTAAKFGQSLTQVIGGLSQMYFFLSSFKGGQDILKGLGDKVSAPFKKILGAKPIAGAISGIGGRLSKIGAATTKAIPVVGQVLTAAYIANTIGEGVKGFFKKDMSVAFDRLDQSVNEVTSSLTDFGKEALNVANKGFNSRTWTEIGREITSLGLRDQVSFAGKTYENAAGNTLAEDEITKVIQSINAGYAARGINKENIAGQTEAFIQGNLSKGGARKIDLSTQENQDRLNIFLKESVIIGENIKRAKDFADAQKLSSEQTKSVINRLKENEILVASLASEYNALRDSILKIDLDTAFSKFSNKTLLELDSSLSNTAKSFGEFQNSLKEIELDTGAEKAKNLAAQLEKINTSVSEKLTSGIGSSAVDEKTLSGLKEVQDFLAKSQGSAEELVRLIQEKGLISFIDPEAAAKEYEQNKKTNLELDRQLKLKQAQAKLDFANKTLIDQRSLAEEKLTKAIEKQVKTLEKTFGLDQEILKTRREIEDTKFERSLIGLSESAKLSKQKDRVSVTRDREIQDVITDFRKTISDELSNLQSEIPDSLPFNQKRDIRNQIYNAQQSALTSPLTGENTKEQIGALQFIGQTSLNDIAKNIQDAEKKASDLAFAQTKLTADMFDVTIVGSAEKFSSIILTALAKEKIMSELKNAQEIKNGNFTDQDKALADLAIKNLQDQLDSLPQPGTSGLTPESAKRLAEIEQRRKELTEKMTEAQDENNKSTAKGTDLNQQGTLANDRATVATEKAKTATQELSQSIGEMSDVSLMLSQRIRDYFGSLPRELADLKFGALQSTNPNDLASNLIKQDVISKAPKQGGEQDLATIAAQTALREKGFELATAESATRRRELEYELKYLKEFLALKEQGATVEELADLKNKQTAEQRSGGRGFEKGLDTIQERIDNYRTTLGEEIPNLFSSNLAQGLNDAISGAKDLKTALTDAATSFFQEITRKNISNLADMVTGGLGSLANTGFSALKSAFPGGVTTKASGGFIKGGSGTKDDVPAMLMGGEYVVKKSAVNKYGKGFLDAINSGNMRGYATGGLVDPETFPTQTGRSGFFTPGDYGQGAITGKNELLTFATQSFTGGQYDYMGGFGMSGASVGLEPESARLSSFGRENSPMFERVQQSKDEAFGVYLQGLQKEKEYSQLLDQIAKDKKARKKQLQMAIISAVASTALNFAGSAMLSGAKNAIASGAKTAAAGGKTFGFGAKFMAGAKGMFTGAGGQGGLANIFKGTGTQLSDLAIARQNAMSGNIASQSVQGVMSSTLQPTITESTNLQTNNSFLKKFSLANLFSQFKGFFNKSSGPKAQGSGSDNSLLPLPSYIQQEIVPYSTDGRYNPYIKRASGGLISGGSGTKDDVPAMLTGGEFVLNNRATQRLGVQNLNKLNNGQSVGSESSSAEMTQALISKLDELIQTTSNSSQSNVVVNVSSTDQQEENPADMNERDRELQKKIRQAVLDVIAQEKRLGGSLEKSR
jgi:TP901 family phage tail tape measure protein